VTRRPAPTRALRGGLLAVTSSALTITAHGVGGGSVADFGPAVPFTLLIAAAATALADRRRGTWTVLAALFGAQLGQHALLSWVGHRHPAPGMGIGFNSVQMTVAHVLAALLTGLLLARADTALVALAAAVSRLAPRRLTPLAASTPLHMPSTRPSRTDTPIDVLLTRVHRRRGPPDRS
jgi:hypothetical protein